MKPQNSLLTKVILLFISIFIPLAIVGIISINLSNQKLKNQVLTSIDSNNENYISQLNTSLDNIYINMYNLINQSNFRNFSHTYNDFSPYDKRTQVNLIQEQLTGLQIATPLIDSAHIYFFNHAISFHTRGYTFGTYNHLDSNSIRTFKQMTQGKQLSYYYENPISESLSLDLFIAPEVSEDYAVGVTISPYELKKYLKKNSAYKNEGHFLFSDSAFRIDNLPESIEADVVSRKDELIQKSSTDSLFKVKLGGSNYYVFSYKIPSLSAKYMRLIPTSSLLQNINTGPTIVLIFFLFVFVACILFFIGAYRLIHKPLYQLTTAFEELEEGNFSVSINDRKNADFFYLFQAFNNMTSKLNLLIEQDYQQQILLQKAELKQLQAQINPHFLYNSFFMLQRMIKMDLSEESQEMTSALGAYFRYLTRNSMDNVTLETEYEHAKTYSYIQGLRFAGRIQITFEELPSSFKYLDVPKLILQPLIENAFDYGLDNKMENGQIKVRFFCSSTEPNKLTIIVEDNGDDLTDDLLQDLNDKLKRTKKPPTT
ncbi:sensor histidine kinase [Enterococcus alcedinis]|uniref:sensor histidine kinase n=1 Tax=Enterococcus alcedinis TaxID=1274384 RepID=UPI00360BBBE2